MDFAIDPVLAEIYYNKVIPDLKALLSMHEPAEAEIHTLRYIYDLLGNRYCQSNPGIRSALAELSRLEGTQLPDKPLLVGVVAEKLGGVCRHSTAMECGIVAHLSHDFRAQGLFQGDVICQLGPGHAWSSYNGVLGPVIIDASQHHFGLLPKLEAAGQGWYLGTIRSGQQYYFPYNVPRGLYYSTLEHYYNTGQIGEYFYGRNW